MMSALDVHREARATNLMDDRRCANEWDGIVWFLEPTDNPEAPIRITTD